MATCMIYMAAGNNRRFGSNKLLHVLDGRPMYLHVLERLAAAAREKEGRVLLVVTQYPEIMEQVKAMGGFEIPAEPLAGTRCEEEIQTRSCHLASKCMEKEQLWNQYQAGGACQSLYAVYSPQSRGGVSYTIRAGLEAARQVLPCCAGYAFFTADQPYLSAGTIRQFLDVMERELPPLGSICYDGRPGSPTWFAAEYAARLRALTGDTGGRRILKEYPDAVRYVQAASDRELWDVDLSKEVLFQERAE